MAYIIGGYEVDVATPSLTADGIALNGNNAGIGRAVDPNNVTIACVEDWIDKDYNDYCVAVHPNSNTLEFLGKLSANQISAFKLSSGQVQFNVGSSTYISGTSDVWTGHTVPEPGTGLLLSAVLILVGIKKKFL